jgi:hypothetical protein
MKNGLPPRAVLVWSAAMSGSAGEGAAWDVNLTGKLEVFADYWKSFQGTEQSGAQDFLRKILEIYDVSLFRPGTIFEQHPVRFPARGKGGQHSLFADDEKPAFTTERMDIYLPKICVWEMKAPTEKDLSKHHDQILRYWSRVRTRYMVLCNFREFWIYDTENEDGGQLVPALILPLHELPARSDALLFLRGEQPDLTSRSERVTARIAAKLGQLVQELIRAVPEKERNTRREPVTKLVLECVFAMFAEDTELVPPRMFSDVLGEADMTGRMDAVWSLFDDFGRKDPKSRGHRFAPYVNGPLFDQAHPKLQLSGEQIHILHAAAAEFDWQDVRPEIFGSIFEQAFNSDERHELGAHFTREADILRVVGPTVIEPWRARIHATFDAKDVERVIGEMRAFHVLDPACGCGNFLYVIYREMKRLEAALVDAWNRGQQATKRKKDRLPPPELPYFTLNQIHGIEKSGFAAYLSRVVMWIAEHLAKRELGLEEEILPLKSLDENIIEGDALFVPWPRPKGELAIVGNPPYMGVRKMRHELGDDYVEKIFERFPDNRAGDYVTYWFTRAADVLKPGERAGYVATNSITQNDGREAGIDRILAKGGTITDAWKSYPWPGEAGVHIVIVNWVMEQYDGIRKLDGAEVTSISPTLTASTDVTTARPIPLNEKLCFMGVTPGNIEFVLDAEQRDQILTADPGSAEVIKPYLIGRDVNRDVDQCPTRWIIDFGMLAREHAEAHVGAFRYVQRHVYKSKRAKSDRKTDSEKDRWWQMVRPRPELREALQGLKHALVIPAVTRHLIVSRQETTICFDHKLMVVALNDHYHFGILQSRLHETWAWARGSTLKADLAYTNTTIFETFPFPLHAHGKYDPRALPKTKEAKRIAETAEAFDNLRTSACKAHGLGLTKIHNMLKAGELPELVNAYEALNDAVTACYGFPKGAWKDEKETLRLLLELNHKIVGQMPLPP